jgi:hypothetical protein
MIPSLPHPWLPAFPQPVCGLTSGPRKQDFRGEFSTPIMLGFKLRSKIIYQKTSIQIGNDHDVWVGASLGAK